MQLVNYPEKPASRAATSSYPEAADGVPDRLEGRQDVRLHGPSGLKFSDGSPVTAAAFQRAIERA